MLSIQNLLWIETSFYVNFLQISFGFDWNGIKCPSCFCPPTESGLRAYFHNSFFVERFSAEDKQTRNISSFSQFGNCVVKNIKRLSMMINWCSEGFELNTSWKAPRNCHYGSFITRKLIDISLLLLLASFSSKINIKFHGSGRRSGRIGKA